MRKYTLIIAIGSLVLMSVLAWLPFGFRIVGMAEEWRMMADYDIQINFGESYNRLRPLQTMPLVLAYLAQPHSFEAANVLLFVALLTKGIALFLLLRLLFPERVGMALLAALLFVHFPADEGVYVLRAMTHNIAVALLTLGAWCFFTGLASRRWVYFVGYGLCVAVSLLIYEVGYPVVLLLAVLPFSCRVFAARPGEDCSQRWVFWQRARL